MKLVAYTRLSVDTEKNGIGLEVQEERIRSYCNAYEDYAIVAIKSETKSGSSRHNRTVLNECLNMLQTGEADGLIVYKLDRLTRNRRDLDDLILDYFKEKYHLLSVVDHIDTKSANGRFMLNVLADIAQWEREVIAERTKAALQQKIANGKILGRVGYGQQHIQGTRVDNPTEQAILQTIVQLKQDGHTLQSICDTLTSKGMFNRSGRPFLPGSVANIIKRLG